MQQKSVTGRLYVNCRAEHRDRKSTRLKSSHITISYAVFCLKKKKLIKGHQFSKGLRRRTAALGGADQYAISQHPRIAIDGVDRHAVNTTIYRRQHLSHRVRA